MKLFDKFKHCFSGLSLDSLGRYTLLGGIFFALLLYILLRILVVMFGSEGRRWREVGNQLRLPTEVVIPAHRGTIYSSDARPIAVMAPHHKLELDFQADILAPLYIDDTVKNANPKLAKKSQELADTLKKHLALLADALIEEVTVAPGQKALNRRELLDRWHKDWRRRKRGSLLINEISFLEYQRLKNRAPLRIWDPKEKKYRSGLLLKMISRTDRLRRIVPFGSLAQRTIGGVYPIQRPDLTWGSSGLELHYDHLLRGQDGQGLSRYHGGRTVVDQTTPPINGVDLYTTLDMNKQNILEGVLRQRLVELRAERGSAILMEVQTGRILGLTNLERKKNGRYEEGTNYAVSALVDPGSTFKIASMMVALEDGIVHETDLIDVGNGLWPVAGAVVRDEGAGGSIHRQLTPGEIIARSSNVGVAKIISRGYASRPDDYVQKVRDLGFGLDLDLEIPGYARASIRKRSDNPKNWFATTLPWMSHGYETQIPPIYTLAFYNAIANAGRFMRPYLVDSIYHPQKDSMGYIQPRVMIESICSPATLHSIQGMLRQVVLEGTGRKLRSDLVAISGKSGTAQISQGKQGYKDKNTDKKHEASFCAYFPSEAPKYSCIVVIREPAKEFRPSGGSMAGPVVRDLAEALLALEAPIPVDNLLPEPNLEAHRFRPITGRKGESQSVAARLQPSYKGDPTIAPDEFVRIESSGSEARLPELSRGIIPSVVGMTATDAIYRLMSLGYVCSLEGSGLVVAQSLAPGTKARSGTKIRLQLQ